VSPEAPREPARAPAASGWSHPFFWLATITLLVAIFSRAQEVLVPLALSVVVAFALTPAVKALERRVGRGLAVAVVVFCALGGVSAFGYLLKRQFTDLSTQATRYAESMRRKVTALRGAGPGGLGSFSRTVDKLVHEFDEQVSEQQQARPVKIVPDQATALERAEAVIEPVLKPLAKVAIVLVLVVFFLSQREDLRDRLIRVSGRTNVTLTTRTLDEAGSRISRFLLVQSAINGGFGVAVSIGLLAIGVPFAPLWGFVTAVLRFVPFVGTLLSLLFPAMLAFAQFEGWGHTLATVGLFVGLDVLAAYVVEPLAVGRKTGVSSMALLVMTIFWTWLWGPAGLVMATPLTVCLVVLGRQVPRLRFLAILLGDGPPLETRLTFYQRLLAGDDDEASEIVETQLRRKPRTAVLDAVVVPTLTMAAGDRARAELTAQDHEGILRMTRSIVEGLGDTPAPVLTAPGRTRVLGIPARNEGDELLLDLFRRSLPAERYQVDCVGASTLAAEAAAAVAAAQPDIVCITAVPPGALGHVRYLCRKLRAARPSLRILVLRPGPAGEQPARGPGEPGSAQASSLAEALEAIERLALLEAEAPSPRAHGHSARA
jgi:predicted PurR-regulated permease PerM